VVLVVFVVLVVLVVLVYKILEELVSFVPVVTSSAGISNDKQLCPLLSLISENGITIPVASSHKRVCKSVAETSPENVILNWTSGSVEFLV